MRIPWPRWIRNRFDTRQRRVLLVVALLLCSPAIVAAANHLTNAAHTSGEIPLSAPNGPTVIVVDEDQIDLTNPFPASDTVDIVATGGNVTVDGADGASVTIDTIEGTWTNTSSLDVIGKPITIDPGDKPAVDVSGDITSLDWRGDMAPDDGTTDFAYASSLGSGSITLRGLPSTTQLGAVDADSNTLLDTATTDGSGTATFSGLDSGSHNVALVTSEGGPALSGATPTGSVDTNPTQLSVNVSDPDFPTGDEVDVVFSLDGSTVDTQTITSNGTVTAAISSPTGGSHTWSVEATDGYGQSVTETYSMNIPSTLKIYNESDPDTLINSPTTVTLQFFAGDTIVERSTSNGTVDLTGLPVDEPIFVKADADGYQSRTVYLKSLYQQQEMYLLDENVTTTTTRFTLGDTPGFPSEDSVVFVERPITKNGTTTWKTIVSDEFGVSGVTTHLEEGVRYRIEVENIEANKVATLGAYAATVDETVELQPQPPGIGVNDEELDVGHSVVQTDTELRIEYSDPTNETDSLKLWIHERGDESHRLVPNATYKNLGELNEIQPLTGAEANTSWQVVMFVERDGESFVIRRNVGTRPGALVPTDLDPMWLQFIAVALLVLFAGIFSIHTRGVGAFAVAAVGAALWWVGWLGTMASGAAVAMALGIGIMVMLTDSPGPGLG